MKLDRIVQYLDTTLRTVDFASDSAMNGLQVECSRNITKVATAVDACRESITRAASSGAELLIVHHGLFWGEMAPLTGVMGKRIGLLFSKGISLYAAHLPLDCHKEIGNNIGLARLLELESPEPFGLYRGIKIGLCGTLPKRMTLRALSSRLKKDLGSSPKIFPFGPSDTKRLGIVSGGGSSLVQQAGETGCDTLLTGEPAHSVYHTAREARINLVCAGHYATETLGVKSLGELLESELGLTSRFIDVPTGL
jgi:dinuclear metal center YbgI/SA1388 family protein